VNTLPLLATCLLRTCFADGLLTHTPCTRSCPRADTSARVRKDSSITSSAQRREPRADESLWIEMPSAQRTAALAIPSFTFDGGPGAQKNRALRHERRETSAPPRSDLKKVEFANSFAQSRRPAARTLLSTPIGTPNRYPGDVADTIRVVRPAHASIAALDKYASADSSPSRSLSPTSYTTSPRASSQGLSPGSSPSRPQNFALRFNWSSRQSSASHLPVPNARAFSLPPETPPPLASFPGPTALAQQPGSGARKRYTSLGLSRDETGSVTAPNAPNAPNALAHGLKDKFRRAGAAPPAASESNAGPLKGDSDGWHAGHDVVVGGEGASKVMDLSRWAPCASCRQLVHRTWAICASCQAPVGLFGGRVLDGDVDGGGDGGAGSEDPGDARGGPGVKGPVVGGSLIGGTSSRAKKLDRDMITKDASALQNCASFSGGDRAGWAGGSAQSQIGQMGLQVVSSSDRGSGGGGTGTGVHYKIRTKGEAVGRQGNRRMWWERD